MSKDILRVMAKRVRKTTRRVARRSTAQVLSDDAKRKQIEGWAKYVGLDGATTADALIAKYGLNEAYNLAKEAMYKPSDLAKKQGFTFRSSKGCLQYLAKDADVPQRTETTQVRAEDPKKTQTQQTSRPVTAKGTSSRVALGTVEATPIPQDVRLANDKVKENHKMRYAYMDAKFPQLNEKDFSSHAEYMKALRQQYKEMRSYDWEVSALQESVEMYNISVGNDPNILMWKKQITEKKDSMYRDQHIATVEQLNGTRNASCAGTATRVDMAICERFGCKESECFYGDYKGCRSAKSIHDNPKTKQYRHEGKSFKAMIEAGYVGPGTMISVPSVAPSSKASGYHAMTVAEVIRDKNGKITDVVLQANNGTCLTKYPVSTIDSSLRSMDRCKGQNRPFIVTSANVWAQDRINSEERAISDAELEKRVAAERASLYQKVDRLAKVEDEACANKLTHAQTVSKSTTEHKAMIEAINPQYAMSVRATGYNAYTEAERKSVRTAMLSMTATGSKDRNELAQVMKSDAAKMNENIDKFMDRYSKGKGFSAREMQLMKDLMSSFLASDGNKNLTDFHQFIDSATQSSNNLQLALTSCMRNGR